MPSRYLVFPEHSLLYKWVWGKYGEAENKAAHRERHSLALEMDLSGYAEIQDLSDVTSYEITVDRIRALASQYVGLSEDDRLSGKFVATRLAYVAPAPIAFGTARVYDALTSTSSLNFRVFTELGQAVEWLQLPPAAMDAIRAARREQA